MACLHLKWCGLSSADGESLLPCTSCVSLGKFVNQSVLGLLRIKLRNTLMNKIDFGIHKWLLEGSKGS